MIFYYDVPTHKLLGHEYVWCRSIDFVLVVLSDRNNQSDVGFFIEVLLSRCLDLSLYDRLALGERCLHVPDVKGGHCGVLVHLEVKASS